MSDLRLLPDLVPGLTPEGDGLNFRPGFGGVCSNSLGQGGDSLVLTPFSAGPQQGPHTWSLKSWKNPGILPRSHPQECGGLRKRTLSSNADISDTAGPGEGTCTKGPEAH